jgi:hypothetical protein
VKFGTSGRRDNTSQEESPRLMLPCVHVLACFVRDGDLVITGHSICPLGTEAIIDSCILCGSPEVPNISRPGVTGTEPVL